MRGVNTLLLGLAGLLVVGCDGELPVPELPDTIWYTDAGRYGCEAFEEAQGDYLQSQFTHEPAGSNFCEVENILFNCHAIHFSAPFSISDFVNDDPGPWHREADAWFNLYDDPGGGALLTSGSGTIDYTSISMTAHTIIGSAVDVQLQSGWSGGPTLMDTVMTAQIDQFDGSLVTTASHDFVIDGDYAPRAFVEANMWGEYGGFPLVPFALTSGSFSATGTVSADYTACQEVRLWNEDEMCVYAPQGGPAAAPCGSGSGVSIHVHADTNNLVLLDLASFTCLTVSPTETDGHHAITHEVCSGGLDERQQWTWGEDGALHPIAYPSYCLGPNPDDTFVIDTYPGPIAYEPMVAEPCSGSPSQTWSFY